MDTDKLHLQLPPLRKVLSDGAGFAKKSLGQNFIFDETVLDSIASCAFSATENPKDFNVIEVGGGIGSLTRAILKKQVKRLTVIEKDTRCIGFLEQIKKVYGERIEIKEADALEVKANEIGEAPRKIIANLPYNISTVLLMEWVHHINDFSSLTLMFQKEVADRLAATPNCSMYGRLSVLVQAFCNIEIKMVLPPEVFSPPPKVHSSLVHITPKKELCKVSFNDLSRVAKAAFLHRRKMLKKSLQELGNTEELCEAIGVSNDRRPENLNVEDFINLTAYLEGK